MLKRKLSTIILAATITNMVSTPINVLAETLNTGVMQSVENQGEEKTGRATITKFNLYSSELLESYDELFKMDNSNIKSINNNGGKYASSTIDKAIDGKFQTHWETGTPNSATFTNEVVIELEEATMLNRIVYSARRDAGGKGFAQAVEIYASNGEENSEFELVAEGTYGGSSLDIVEIKFAPTEFKKLKFVFKNANSGWASASEFMFYKEDAVSDKMNRLFTDETLSVVSEEFNTIEKINALDEEVKAHPLYENFKENIENAKLIIEGNNISYIDASVSNFKDFNSEELIKYNELFKLPIDKVTSITTNGGHYGSSNIEKAIDGDINTAWHSGKTNNNTFTNEVVMTLDEITTLNRIVYTASRGTNRGFAEEFDIYASTTSKGDTFELVSSGTASKTQNSIEIKFNPTEFKRIKFVFKKGYENWALAAEFALYKQDEISEKVERLFTDSTMSVVSEEFNTVDKINELEEEAKSHPFYEEYKEDLKNARELIEIRDVNYTDAKVSKFIDINSELLPAYDEVYKLSLDKIISITTNGGHYGSSNIEKAIDGDASTSWHSGRQNTSDFTNEVVITLDEVTTLNRIVYTSGRGTNRGFAEAFDIYASTTSKGDTFKLVSSGTSSVTQNSIEIKFNPTEFKRVKFVFKKGYENWALASEIGLYTQDETSENIEKLFVNGLMTEVSEEFNTIDKINVLEIEVNEHPLRDKLLENIELAKEIVSNPNLFEDTRIVTAEQRGRYREEMALRSINGAAYASFESIGKYVTAGEEIVVYVDADANGVLPQLCFGQVGDDQGDWRRWANLQPGKNVIKAPMNINPSALYVVNHAKPEDQAYAPRVRVEGGTEFPIYIHGETDPNEFYNELKEYASKIEYSDEAFAAGNPEGKFFNITELISENCVITTSAMGALAGLNEVKDKDLTVYNTMEEWEEMYDMFQTFQGLSKDAEKEEDSYFPNKFIARVFKNVPLGFADHGYTGYLGSDNEKRDGGFFKLIAMPITYRTNDNWCYTHEFGHIFNSQYIVDGEVTNNLYAQEYRRIKGLGGDRANWDEIMKRFKGEEFAMHYFERLAVLSQLNIAYGYDAYAKASQALRDNKELITSIKGNDIQRLVVAYSLGLNVDLLDFFKGWNYCNVEITEQMREAVSHLPKLDKKIEYLHSGAYDYAGDGFTEDIKVNVNSTVNEEENTVTLSFSVDKDNQDDVLGYEILKDGEVIGYTKTTSFNMNDINLNEATKYEVVAYAKDLSTAKSVEVKLLKPTLSVEENITLAVGSEFNASNYVTALNYKGEIIENITIEGDVNTAKKGNYEVTYSVNDRDINIEKKMKVNVVSKITYASDIEATSVKVGWGAFGKDKAPNSTPIELDRQGVVARYAKGLGTHADSEVIYNVEEYDRFESYIGIDQSMRNNGSSSASFIVYVDGEKVYDSGKYTSNRDHEFISIDLRGASELKLVTDDLGNNSADQTVWADAKFINDNTKPSIVVDNKNVKIGEDIDFMEGVTASDIEDGDLTSNVEIISNNFEKNKLGRFEVVYRVADSDNNVTEEKAYVTVYEELITTKSKYGEFDTLDAYNEAFKIPVALVSNNGGNYSGSPIGNSIDGNINTHWETGRPNNSSFNNEVIFDLGEIKEVDKIAYAARRGGKGFATKFEIYVSTEAEGNDFILAGQGSYNGNRNDVIEIDITKTEARRVKFKFVEAYDFWASIGEVSFYKTDELADKIKNELFTDSNKIEVKEAYNTLEKLEALREEVSNHPASALFQVDLEKAEKIIVAKFPTITVGETEYIKLRSEYDLMTGVGANDQEDGDITSAVVVNKGNFTVEKTGQYTISYTVTDSDGNVSTKERTIVVYSDREYISNIDWTSARTDYGQVRKDLASGGAKIRVNVNGEERVFDKGIGTHANSEIVYNLEGTNYEYFESYVAVDRNIVQQNNSSIIFMVYADGEEVYNSGVMKWADEAKLIRVSLEGVSELKLVVNNAGNGNSSDHGSFADAKFLITNSKPTLNIPKSVSTRLGQVIELNEEYSAADAEDGVLTSNVEVSGDVNFNKAGEYTITYKVTDSDGNETVKSRTVAVVDMNDYSYLTDYEWKSTSNSYTAPLKDISTSRKVLRLTDENGQEVSYERGIGAHSTSTIIYDLTNKNYDYFTSYVGVDRQMYNTIGSVTFEIYVDGEKKFDSGLMNSKDSQRFVEVDINGAKELKLVVTDGKNGNGSDHATWGDTKLHYANNESVEVNRSELDSLVEVITKLDSTKYLEESFTNLQVILEEVKTNLADGYNQEEINTLYTKLNEAYEGLVKLADFSELEIVLNKVEVIDKELYTEETLAALEEVLERANTILSDKTTAQEVVDDMAKELQVAIDSLVMIVDLNEVVNIADRVLRDAIKETLGLTSNTITIGDMYKLTSLKSEGLMIRSLEGLQYAKNLESLSFNYNEIQNLSQLKGLKKLKDISVMEQYIAVGMATTTDGRIVINEDVLDINGERLIPKEILIGHKNTFKNIDPISAVIDGIVSIDSSVLYSGVNSIALRYESLDGKYTVQTLYMINN